MKFTIGKIFTILFVVSIYIFFNFSDVKATEYFEWTATPEVASVEVGKPLLFTITAKYDGYIDVYIPGPINLYCPNCSAVNKISFISSSSLDGIEKDISVIYTFNSAEYLKLISSKLPVTIPLVFIASKGTNQDTTETYEYNIEIKDFDCKQFNGNENKNKCDSAIYCVWTANDSGKCFSKSDEEACKVISEKDQCVKSKVCALDKNNKCVLAGVASKQQRDTYASNVVDQINIDGHPVSDDYKGPLPPCAFWGGCRDVNALVEVGLRVVDYIFSIVAALAFVFFIYGGFTWIFSFGSPDKIKKGQQIFVYAVIGLVIVFSAYILVGFLLDALNVSETFRGIKK